MGAIQNRTAEEKAKLATKALKILQKQARASDAQFSINGVLCEAGLTNAESCAAYILLRELDLVVKIGPKVKNQYHWDIDQVTKTVTTTDVVLAMAVINGRAQKPESLEKADLASESVLTDPLGVIDQLVAVIGKLEERIEELEILNRALTNGSDEARKIISRYS